MKMMRVGNALENRYNFVRFQVFQWLIEATDGHIKNFSIYIDKGRSYRLLHSTIFCQPTRYWKKGTISES
ncbi:HipA domain-containing protein [Vibrio coralliilyticus]|uniref:HipA domain-containing protein n=2 Tax=Vibrio coralliilyticus TaxID=190893 RepID=UPI0030B871DA